MAVYTFSTRPTRPVDSEAIQRVKDHCDSQGLNFSALVVSLLKKWEEDNVKRPTKV